ncbi:MAG: YybH family protein [Chloroflexota bacterium]
MQPYLTALVELYQDAVNHHDLATIMSLYGDDVAYELVGQDLLTGKERLRAYHDYEAGIGSTVTIEGCKAEGDSIVCRMRECNQWLVAAGLPPIEYPRVEFSFDGTQIRRLVLEMTEETLHQVGEVMQAFMPWALSSHPREAESLFSAAGEFIYSRESGELALRLMKEWRGRR